MRGMDAEQKEERQNTGEGGKCMIKASDSLLFLLMEIRGLYKDFLHSIMGIMGMVELNHHCEVRRENLQTQPTW